MAQYEEWVSTFGIWELTEPSKKTFSSGNSLDKFLYVQGDIIPAVFLGESAMEGDENEPATSYPGQTEGEEKVANHHPLSLSLPHEDSGAPPPCRKLHIKGVTEASWKERNGKLKQDLAKKQTEISRLGDAGNAQRLHALLMSPLKKVRGDLYT